MAGNRDNLLWEKHRFMLPAVRTRAIHRCKDYRYFVLIKGKSETKNGCVVSIKAYGNREKRIHQVLPVTDVIKRVGLEGLDYCLKLNDPEAQSCGRFELK